MTEGTIQAAGVALVALLMAGCGGASLAEEDPRGAEACEALTQAIRYEGDVEQYTGQLLLAGKAADKANTEGITATVGEPIEGLEDFPMVDAEALYRACEDEGVDMPESDRLP